MQINGSFSVHGAQSIQPSAEVAPANEAQPVETSLQPVDELEISSEASMVAQIYDVPDVRMDRVAEIREQIAQGVYETSEKLDVAVGRLLNEIA